MRGSPRKRPNWPRSWSSRRSRRPPALGCSEVVKLL
jgi:hypothetical protein